MPSRALSIEPLLSDEAVDDDAKQWHQQQQQHSYATNSNTINARHRGHAHALSIANIDANSDDGRGSDDVDTTIVKRFRTRRYIFYLNLVFLVVLIVYGLLERGTLTSGTAPNISTESLALMNDSNYTTTITDSDSDNDRVRVVYILIDGLRYDAITATTNNFSTLLSSPLFVNDSLVMRMTAQIPTISVPNWYSLMTGATPSLHGRLANDDEHTFTFDSVFRSVRRSSKLNGLVGGDYMAEMLAGHLSPYHGDGTSPTTVVDYRDPVYQRGASSHNKDNAYYRSTIDAINSRSVTKNGSVVQFQYDLFLYYQADVDNESHAWGSLSSQTQSAIDDTVGKLESLIVRIDKIDSRQGGRTMFVLTSDHGHVDVGGHGGDASVLTDIPLIVYSKGSMLASAVSNSTLPSYSAYENVDIPTTIAAILGVPVPRQTEGTFIAPLLSTFVTDRQRQSAAYYDLFRQKQLLVSTLINQWGLTKLQRSNNDLLKRDIDVSSNPIAELNDRIIELRQLLAQAKSSYIRSKQSINIAFSIIFAIVLAVLLPMSYTRWTFADISAVLPDRLHRAVSMVGGKLVTVWRQVKLSVLSLYLRFTHLDADASSNSDSGSDSSYCSIDPAIRRFHRFYLLLSISFLALFWSLQLFLLLVLFRYGYRSTAEWRWQFTLFNSEYDAYVLIVGICIIGALVNYLMLVLAILAVYRCWNSVVDRLTRYLSVRLTFADHFYYFVENLSLSNALVVVVFLTVQCYHCLYLPFIHPVTVISESAWTLRFQSLNISFVLTVLTFLVTVMERAVSHRVFAGRMSEVVRQPKDVAEMVDGGVSDIDSASDGLLSLASIRSRRLPLH